MTGNYIVVTGDGIEYYETEEAAQAAAQKAIDAWRDCCDPGWPEEVQGVSWGLLMQAAQPTISDPGSEGSVAVDYLLVDVGEVNMQQKCGKDAKP